LRRRKGCAFFRKKDDTERRKKSAITIMRADATDAMNAADATASASPVSFNSWAFMDGKTQGEILLSQSLNNKTTESLF
jgi:hypothetical protein